MKDLPELDAELSGLLAEIAADPRSRLRLAPKRALRSWYLSDEVVRPRDFDRTKAERHLLAAHRDALAELLLRAARVAYWRKPTLSIPLDRSGKLYSPAELEREWPKRPAGELRESLATLLEDPGRIRFEHGEALATAALALVPRDDARLVLGCTIKKSQPRSAGHLLDQLAGRLRDPKIRGSALLESGSCSAFSGDLGGAVSRYDRAAPSSPLAFLCLFNLYAFLGDVVRTREFIAPMKQLPGPETVSSCDLLRTWAKEQSMANRKRARSVFTAVSSLISESAEEMSKIYEI